MAGMGQWLPKHAATRSVSLCVLRVQRPPFRFRPLLRPCRSFSRPGQRALKRTCGQDEQTDHDTDFPLRYRCVLVGTAGRNGRLATSPTRPTGVAQPGKTILSHGRSIPLGGSGRQLLIRFQVEIASCPRSRDMKNVADCGPIPAMRNSNAPSFAQASVGSDLVIEIADGADLQLRGHEI